MAKFSLDKYLDDTFDINEIDQLEDDVLFDKGFTGYVYPMAVFQRLTMNFRVKTKCPINDSEDIIKVEVEYTTNLRGELIEHHSFMRWIDTFRSMGMGLEATCGTIYERLEEVIRPTNLKVVAKSHSSFNSYNSATREKTWE